MLYLFMLLDRLLRSCSEKRSGSASRQEAGAESLDRNYCRIILNQHLIKTESKFPLQIPDQWWVKMFMMLKSRCIFITQVVRVFVWKDVSFFSVRFMIWESEHVPEVSLLSVDTTSVREYRTAKQHKLLWFLLSTRTTRSHWFARHHSTPQQWKCCKYVRQTVTFITLWLRSHLKSLPHWRGSQKAILNSGLVWF